MYTMDVSRQNMTVSLMGLHGFILLDGYPRKFELYLLPLISACLYHYLVDSLALGEKLCEPFSRRLQPVPLIILASLALNNMEGVNNTAFLRGAR